MLIRPSYLGSPIDCVLLSDVNPKIYLTPEADKSIFSGYHYDLQRNEHEHFYMKCVYPQEALMYGELVPTNVDDLNHATEELNIHEYRGQYVVEANFTVHLVENYDAATLSWTNQPCILSTLYDQPKLSSMGDVTIDLTEIIRQSYGQPVCLMIEITNIQAVGDPSINQFPEARFVFDTANGSGMHRWTDFPSRGFVVAHNLRPKNGNVIVNPSFEDQIRWTPESHTYPESQWEEFADNTVDVYTGFHACNLLDVTVWDYGVHQEFAGLTPNTEHYFRVKYKTFYVPDTPPNFIVHLNKYPRGWLVQEPLLAMHLDGNTFTVDVGEVRNLRVTTLENDWKELSFSFNAGDTNFALLRLRGNPMVVDDVYLATTETDVNGGNGVGGDLTPLAVIGGLGIAGAVAYYLWKGRRK
jgi:hypothetical protein